MLLVPQTGKPRARSSVTGPPGPRSDHAGEGWVPPAYNQRFQETREGDSRLKSPWRQPLVELPASHAQQLPNFWTALLGSCCQTCVSHDFQAQCCTLPANHRPPLHIHASSLPENTMEASEEIDLTNEELEEEQCPVCGLRLPIMELPAHVETHFAAEGPTGPGAAPNRATCTVCGASVELAELDRSGWRCQGAQGAAALQAVPNYPAQRGSAEHLHCNCPAPHSCTAVMRWRTSWHQRRRQGGGSWWRAMSWRQPSWRPSCRRQRASGQRRSSSFVSCGSSMALRRGGAAMVHAALCCGALLSMPTSPTEQQPPPN